MIYSTYQDSTYAALEAAHNAGADHEIAAFAADVKRALTWALRSGADPADLHLSTPLMQAALSHAEKETHGTSRGGGRGAAPQQSDPSATGLQHDSPGTPESGVDGGAPPAGVRAEPASGGPSLAHFTQTLRDYQQAVLDDAAELIESCWLGQSQEWRRIYSAPTGTGKGTLQLAMLKGLREQDVNAWILTPSLEVLRGYLERCGAGSLGDVGVEKLAELGEAVYVTTPTRMRNRILTGDRATPEVVIYDEVHHATENNDVSGTLFAVAPDAVWLGFTATPYRASPRATQALREAWGEPVEVLTIPDAVEAGYQALPTFEVCALVDDDKIKVVNGEFQEKAVTKAVTSRIADLAGLVQGFVNGGCEFDHPTAVAVPSSEVAGLLVEELDRLGIVAYWVNVNTKAAERQRAYEECKARRAVLVSIKVLQEGVDFPWLVRLIDAKPTQSPVAWVQLVGRIMRPKPDGVRPHYLCVCRNLERHAYLLGGVIPREAVKQAQDEFEGPSKRTGSRAIGLEALTKFKAIELPLYGGAKGHMYCLYTVNDDGHVTEFATLVDPCKQEPICASRFNRKIGEDEKGAVRDYGKWAAVPALPMAFEGFATSRFRGKVSKKQAEWWARDAARVGLDPDAAESITQRQFAALPVLVNTGRSLHS